MKPFALALLTTGVLVAPLAQAQSLTGNVGSAGVTRGESSVEARIGINDEGEAGARFHFDHGFTDWYLLRVIAGFEKPEDGDWTYDSLTFENWLQWREEAEDDTGFDGGVRLAYTFIDGGGPDEAEVRLTITDDFAGDWEWRGNLIGEVETGDNSEGGVSVDTWFQLTRALAIPDFPETRLGVELFSEYGNSRDFAALEDQIHQFGPVLKLEWGEGYYLQTAARFGLTDSTDDGMVKLFIGREF